MTESVARLRGEQLTLGYGKYTVAENLTVEIPDGHFTAIIGPNGCGKSTLLRTLSAPHIARRISGTARWGLTQAALCGALLLLAADLCAQQLFMPYQLPVGVVTVSLGGIYLIVLLIQESRKK